MQEGIQNKKQEFLEKVAHNAMNIKLANSNDHVPNTDEFVIYCDY